MLEGEHTVECIIMTYNLDEYLQKCVQNIKKKLVDEHAFLLVITQEVLRPVEHTHAQTHTL